MQRQWVIAFVLGLALVPPMAPAAPAQTPAIGEAADEERETGADAEAQDTGDEPSSAAVEAADDEELAQLLSQAEQLVSADGRASAGEIARLTAALEALQAALARKAEVLEGSPGGGTAEADEQVEVTGTELQSALSEADEEASGGGEAGEALSQEDEAEASAGAGLGRAREFVDLVLGSLERIQALRSTLRSESRAQGELAAEESGDETGEGDDDVDAGSQGASEAESTGEGESEEELGEVTGVITREGQPVEGAVVTDEGSGVRAVSDRLGQYSLEGLPPDAQAHLKVLLGRQTVASGRTEVVRGRSAIADFPLGGVRSPMALPSQRQGARVLASVVSAPRSAGPTGAVNAEVRDASGHPVPRALVRLGSGSVARTDSRGRCTFTNVPVGAHELSTPGNAGKVVSQRVVVKARQGSQAMLQLASHPRLARSLGMGKPVPVRGALGQIRGQVREANHAVVSGAKVELRRPGKTGLVAHAVSDRRGEFLLAALPGTYEMKVQRPTFRSASSAVRVTAGGIARPRVVLAAAATTPGAIQPNRKLVTATAGRDTRSTPSGIASNPASVAAGRGATQSVQGRPARVELRGQVTDLATGKGIAGASISVDGRGRGTTDRRGGFVITGLEPGVHRVRAARAGFSPGERSVNLFAGKESNSVALGLRSTSAPPAKRPTGAPKRPPGTKLS
jgi:hypothetical protein